MHIICYNWLENVGREEKRASDFGVDLKDLLHPNRKVTPWGAGGSGLSLPLPEGDRLGLGPSLPDQ